MASDDDTITRAELAASLYRLGYSELGASTLFQDIISHRESSWLDGDVVRDANKVIWVHTIHGPGWLKVGSAVSWNYEAPERPLTLLTGE